MNKEFVDKEMLVWNDNEGGAMVRHVLFTNKDESCIAVSNGCIDEYKSGKEFGTFKWNHCKEISTKKIVPMEDWEIIEALKKPGCWLKFNFNNNLQGYWNDGMVADQYTITYDFGKTYKPLTKEVE